MATVAATPTTSDITSFLQIAKTEARSKLFRISSPICLFLVIIACMNASPEKRNFMLVAQQLGMATSEYVYLMPNTNSVGNGLLQITYRPENNNHKPTNSSILVKTLYIVSTLGQVPLWQDTVPPFDGLDQQALEAFQYVLLVCRMYYFVF